MKYDYKPLKPNDYRSVISLLSNGFSRSNFFWEKSINELLKYSDYINSNRIGYGLYFEKKLVGIILIISDVSNNTCSLSSLYVQKAHRSQTLKFLKLAISSIKDVDAINDFSAKKRYPIPN